MQKEVDENALKAMIDNMSDEECSKLKELLDERMGENEDTEAKDTEPVDLENIRNENADI